MNKPKKRCGRPLGGKHPANMREYWRLTQSNYRAKMNTNAKKDLNQARKVKP